MRTRREKKRSRAVIAIDARSTFFSDLAASARKIDTRPSALHPSANDDPNDRVNEPAVRKWREPP